MVEPASPDDNCDQGRTGSRISALRLRGAIRERARGRQGLAGRICRISISFTLHLLSSPGTTKIPEIKTAMSFTTTT
jgi:hypothetical protein